MRQISISDFYLSLQEQVQISILGESDETILHSNTDELVEYYFSHNSLAPIEFDPDLKPTFEHKKEVRIVPAHQREEGYRQLGDLNCEFESIVVTIPILPNENIKEILDLQSLNYVWRRGPEVTIGHNALHFSIDIKGYRINYGDDKVAEEINRGITELKTWIQEKNDKINVENAQFKRNIRNFIEQRKVKLNEDTKRISALVQKINIPLKQKQSDADTRIKLDPKPIIKRIKPNPRLPEEYVLDRSKVLDIIQVIDNQGRQFEKTPKTYKDFEEEGLRDVILVSLNALFEGKATGETFSHHGKTDIYLCIDKGNILICECKIWGGKTLYHKAVDQLLSYLTWRQNFGIMITFVKLKDFSKILGQLPDIIQQHTSYRAGYQQIAANHFTSHHKLGQDETKDVEIHHLFYDLYSE